ncbi:hypothetical protein Q8A73_007520 [Channa argus]|nr:hypothetical protein Q8A73_007520 [Channa argus]
MGNDLNSWRWSATGKTSVTGYRNWALGQPNNSEGNQSCVAMNVGGGWNDDNCETRKSVVCYSVNSSTGETTYTAIADVKTQRDALAYCRTYHTDLPMIESAAQNAAIASVKSSLVVWIGLYRVQWKWSDTSSGSFKNWQSGRPNNYDGNDFCAAENSDHLWQDVSCGTKHFFWCHEDTNATGKTYVLVSAQLTWTDARTYCRQYHKDLPIIESAEDNEAVRSLNITTFAWIGLFRVPWTWSDGRNTTFKNFAVGKPDNAQGTNHCAAEGPDHFWVDLPCANNLAFFCTGVPKLSTTLRLKIQTEANMKDPTTNTQILQQINATLMNQGWNDVKLKWRTQVTRQNKTD